MTAICTPFVTEPCWQPSRCLRRDSVPAALRDWLLEPGSLTRRLRHACSGQFRVQLLDQRLARPLRSEAKALGRPTHELALIRQVHLCCNDQVSVFARTVIPLPSLQGGLKRIDKLGNRPLGELLFSDPEMTRSEIEVARLLPQHSLFQASEAHTDEPLWGRRSVFTLYRRPLLVSEFFLPRVWRGAPA